MAFSMNLDGVGSGRVCCSVVFFFFSSRRRHTRFDCDWSSDVCSSDLAPGVELRVVAGSAFGKRSPAPVFSQTLFVGVEIDAHRAFELEAGHEERAVYGLQGDVTVAGTPLPPQHMAVIAHREPVEVKALTRARLMLIGGGKTDGERLIWWDFVASSRELLEEGKVRWREQSFDRGPGGDQV